MKVKNPGPPPLGTSEEEQDFHEFSRALLLPHEKMLDHDVPLVDEQKRYVVYYPTPYDLGSGFFAQLRAKTCIAQLTHKTSKWTVVFDRDDGETGIRITTVTDEDPLAFSGEHGSNLSLYNRIRGVVRYGVADKFLVYKEDDPGFDGNLYVGHNINVNE